MFDNDFETAINFYFFLKESEYVFSQFVNLLKVWYNKSRQKAVFTTPPLASENNSRRNAN